MRRAAAVTGVLVLGLLVVVLSRAEPRLAGSNARVQTSGVSLTIDPGERRCQRQPVPADTAAVRLFASPVWRTAGPIEVVVDDPGRRRARGRVAMLTREEPVAVELEGRLDAELPRGRVCIGNLGLNPVEFAGNLTPPTNSPTNPEDTVFPDDVRTDFLRPGEESWWQLAGTIAGRFALMKASFFGSWTIWALLAVTALVCLAALRLLARELGLR